MTTKKPPAKETNPKPARKAKPTAKPATRKAGAPRTFDRLDCVTRACKCLATSEKGISRIIQDEPDMPSMDSFWKWLDENTDEGRTFINMYARAKQLQAEYMESLLLEIADEARNDYMERIVGKDGETIKVIDKEHIQRTRLRIDTRKWLMAKLHPRKYADTLKLGGDEGLPPVKTDGTVTHSFEDLRAQLAKIQGKA